MSQTPRFYRSRASQSSTLVREGRSLCSPSVRRDSDSAEDQQEEHSSVDLVQVIPWMRDFCGLPFALTESKKMWMVNPPLLITFPMVMPLAISLGH